MLFKIIIIRNILKGNIYEKYRIRLSKENLSGLFDAIDSQVSPAITFFAFKESKIMILTGD